MRPLSPILQRLWNEGWDKGKEESSNKTALSLLGDGIPLEKVAYYTELPLDAVRILKASIQGAV